jgi:hypothetical protein
MPTGRQIGEESPITVLEAALQARVGWADGIISPFVPAPQSTVPDTHAQRRLSTRAQGSALRGDQA